jgi:hypothetical protein
MKHQSLQSYLLFFIPLFSSSALLGQQLTKQQHMQRAEVYGIECGLEQATESLFRNNPEAFQRFKETEAKLEVHTQNYVAKRLLNNSRLDITIPVVVHIVHDNGSENISDFQITDAIDNINEEFSAQRIAGTVDGMGSLQANIGFKFQLATIDPDGNPTNGITRTRSEFTTVINESQNNNCKSVIGWPRDMYLNIWVVRDATSGNNSGFAFLPGQVNNSSNADIDGIVMAYWAFGRTGTSTRGFFHVTTHEVGHWANLRHTFLNGCNSPGDFVDDTPPTVGISGCESQTSCGSADNTENFMDYTSCATMFTHGQSDRMEAAMTSSVSGRNNLWTEDNLRATGVKGSLGVPTELSVSLTSASQVRLSWQDNSQDEDNFIIERSSSLDDGFTQVGSVGQGVTTFIDSNLDPGKTFFYRIFASSDDALSAYSKEINATTVFKENGVKVVGSWQVGLSHTLADGDDRALIFIVSAEHNSDISMNSVSYGGQNMTKLIEQSEVGQYTAYTAAFILTETQLANVLDENMEVNWSATPERGPGYSSLLLENVEQPQPVGGADGAGSTDNNVSSSALATIDGDFVITASTCGNPGKYSLNNDFNKVVEHDLESSTGVAGYKFAKGNAETPSATLDGANRHAILGLVVQAKQDITSVTSSDNAAPEAFRLLPAYPNPFNPETTLSFELSRDEIVSLNIYNLSGKLIQQVVGNKKFPVGLHTLEWNGRDNKKRSVSTGFYVVRFQAGSFQTSQNLLLVR